MPEAFGESSWWSAGRQRHAATGAVVEALRALDIRRLVLVGPYGEAAIARESAFLEEAGFSVVDAIGLDRGKRSNEVPAADWVAVATARDRADADGIFLSGSNTHMFEAIDAVEQALGKLAVTSLQAALWAAVRRLAPKLSAVPAPPALGRLFSGDLQPE